VITVCGYGERSRVCCTRWSIQQWRFDNFFSDRIEAVWASTAVTSHIGSLWWHKNSLLWPSTKLRSWSPRHWTRPVSWAQPICGWSRTCILFRRHSLLSCSTKLWLLVASCWNSNKPSFDRVWRKNGLMPMKWRTSDRYLTCRFSPNYRKGLFRFVYAGFLWLQWTLADFPWPTADLQLMDITIYMSKPSAIGQLKITRSTQPFIRLGSINE